MSDPERIDPVAPLLSAMRDMGLEPRAQVVRGGLRLDVEAPLPDGSRLGILVKGWPEPSEAALAKAEREAELLLQAGAAEHALVVVPALDDERQLPSVLSPEAAAATVEELLSALPKGGVPLSRTPGGTRSGTTPPQRRVFAAVPFDERFEDTFYLAIVPAAEAANAWCERVDEDYLAAPVIQRIHSGIADADLVVADLTGGNANVTYELGFAHALEKPCVHVAAGEPEELPFDLRQWQTLRYTLGRVHRLRAQLERALENLLSREPGADSEV